MATAAKSEQAELHALFDQDDATHRMEGEGDGEAFDGTGCARRICRGQAKFWLITVRTLLVHIGFAVVLLGLTGLVSFLFYRYSPNTTLSGAAVATWGVFIAVAVFLWPVSWLVQWVVLTAATAVLKFQRSSYEWIQVVNHVPVQVAGLAWSMFVEVAWFAVFDQNPLSGDNPSNGRPRTRLDRPFWLTQLFSSYVVLRILLLGRQAILTVNSLKRRSEQYQEQVLSTLYAGHMLSALTRNIKPGVFDEHWEPTAAVRQKYMSEVEAAVSIQRFVRNIILRRQRALPPSAPLTVNNPSKSRSKLAKEHAASMHTADEITARTLAQFEYVQRNFLHVCLGRKRIKTKEHAKRLGEALYAHYAGDASGKVPISAFAAALEDTPLAKVVVLKFDPNNAVLMTKEWIIEKCVQFYDERKNVARSLDDIDSVSRAMGSFLNVGVAILMFFVLTIVFSTGDFAQVTVSLGTLIFAFSFMFASTAQNALTSFTFLFVRNTYDIGDRVLIPGQDARPMYVLRITLNSTLFRVWSGEVTSIPNHILSNEKIINIARSKMMYDSTAIVVDARTSAAKIAYLDFEVKAYCRAHPQEYVADNCAVSLWEINDANRMTLNIIISQTSNFQNGEHVERRKAILGVVREVCTKHNILLYDPARRGYPGAAPPTARASRFSAIL